MIRGPYEGMQGIVCALPPGHRDQPVVRLFVDPGGRPVEPVEIALADAPETEIEIADSIEPPEPARRPARPAHHAVAAPLR